MSDGEEQLGERCGEKEGEHRGCWERIGAGSPFNLLINHANEILTGYSEAVLGGGRKALVLDYTVHVESKKEKRNMLLNKVMGKLLGPRQPSGTADSMKGIKHLGRHAHKNTQRLYCIP